MSTPVKTWRVGSLFAGIGGFDLGLERAGMETAWFCEADPFCRKVLAKHWPDVPCYPDVTTLRGADVEPVDVLCGGFPCQDLSVAGKGAGIDGARSGLWSEYARLIGEIRPRYVVVENVSVLLSRGFGRVLGDLAALGFDAEWDCLPASAFGAPHRRDRLWIIAYPGGSSGRLGEHRSGGPGRQSADPRQSEVVRQDDGQSSPEGFTPRHPAGHVADAQREGLQGRTGSREPREGRTPIVTPRINPRIGGQWEIEPDVGRVANGVPARVDRLRSLGNALVPQIAEWIGRRIVTYEAEMLAVR